jgi:hypothetical protein
MPIMDGIESCRKKMVYLYEKLTMNLNYMKQSVTIDKYNASHNKFVMLGTNHIRSYLDDFENCSNNLPNGSDEVT